MMKLGLFVEGTGHHVAAWRDPDVDPHGRQTLKQYVDIARLAERLNRVNIITVSLLAWSALSALCGASRGFSQLLLIRVGVGVAEAGCSPPAHSLISDYFVPSRRSSALSIYSCGISRTARWPHSCGCSFFRAD